MNYRMLAHVFVVLTFCLCCGANVTLSNCNHNDQPISKIINTFSHRLSRQITGVGNYFFSPLSISISLAMVYLGARGTTKTEIKRALDYELINQGCSDDISKLFQQLIFALEKPTNKYTLNVANGVFIQTGFRVSRNFTSSLETFFKATVGSLNFAFKQEETMRAINQWVEFKTNGMVEKVLSEPLNSLTMMIIMNAIYFKGVWSHQFNEQATWGSIFRSPHGVSKLVPFMMQEEIHHYYHDDARNYSFLEMDYVGDDISMLLVIADDIKEFPDIDLSNEMLCQIRSKLVARQVTVALPKFKMEYKRELTKDMIKMGIENLFSDRANLTGISLNRNDLHVSLIIHKALIDVNEQGSEASGITGVGIDARKRFPLEPVHFWADHPFLFFILDKKTSSILFMGRLSDPTQ